MLDTQAEEKFGTLIGKFKGAYTHGNTVAFDREMAQLRGLVEDYYVLAGDTGLSVVVVLNADGVYKDCGFQFFSDPTNTVTRITYHDGLQTRELTYKEGTDVIVAYSPFIQEVAPQMHWWTWLTHRGRA